MASFPTEFDDAIFGDDTPNIINGLGGNDLIAGGGGDDWLLGGTGNDVMVAGLGADTIDGGRGRDTINYAGYGGPVWVSLRDGVGYLESDPQGDIDSLNSIENVTGSAHADTIIGSAGSNTLRGNGGDDWIIGLEGNDTIFGGSGSDRVEGGAGADTMDGGSNPSNLNDTLDYSGSAAGVVVNLTTGLGQLGDAEGDVFTGFEGIIGSQFKDHLIGDDGYNAIGGGAGKDIIEGKGGDDMLLGGGGTDELFGGDGDDSFRGGTGGDVMKGGAGIDTADYFTAAGGVVMSLANGIGTGGEANGDTYFSVENIYGSQFADVLEGNAGDNEIMGYLGDDQLFGLGGNDKLHGSDGADVLNGGGGNDTIFGDDFGDVEGDSDTLNGGGGDDLLIGGGGADILTGNAGADRFTFIFVTDSTSVQRDTVADFEVGVDKIGIEFDMDETKPIEQTVIEVIGSSSFTFGTAGQVRIYTENGNTFLEAETTGDAIADFVLKFTGIVALTESDLQF